MNTEFVVDISSPSMGGLEKIEIKIGVGEAGGDIR